MNIHGVHHVALRVRDLETMGRFYRDVLGLPELTRHYRADGSPRSIWLSLGPPHTPGSAFLALEEQENPRARSDGPGPDGPRTGLTVLALRIDRDARKAVLEELARKNVPVVHQSRWTVYVRDPEGNRIGLSHYPADPISE